MKTDPGIGDLADGAAGRQSGRLILHHGPDPEGLVYALAHELATPLDDPFAFEVVSVPSRGTERWISQTLATRLGSSGPCSTDGVAAGIDFRPLEQLMLQVIDDATDHRDSWSPQRLPWMVLQAMERARHEPWFSVVATHVWPAASHGRAWSTADRISRLFRSYASERPTMIRAWLAGDDVDAAGSPLAPDRLWQPALFRTMADLSDGIDPTTRRSQAISALAADPGLVDLPPRLSVFGPTRLDEAQLSVLEALALHRRVMIFTPHPSPVSWQRLAGQPQVVGPRADERSWELVHHPLLARLGRDARELQQRLMTAEAVEVANDDTTAAAGLLGILQDDLHQDRRPSTARPDSSISIHRSHGPDRQVEVLREVVLGLLSDHPELEPRDIVVMCPDIEAFAPLIQAAFGMDTDIGTHPGHSLQVRLADRSLLQQNPVLSVVSQVLHLADSRAGLSEVIDLCSARPVAQAFGFAADDLERIHTLAEQAGVRWGLDADHRARFAMQGFGQNTWRAGIDRMLTGVAMDGESDSHLGTALPLAEVDSGDVALIGRLAELITRVEARCTELSAQQPISAWVDTLRRTVETLTKVNGDDSWQLPHALSSIAGLAPDSGPEQTTSEQLGLSDIRSLLGEAFAGRPSRANFRTGAMTVCTLTPMRSIPHKVVCLLGMDEDRFPRRPTPDGDDLLALAPWVGDRDPRSEDRQLLLDAILAARSHLVIIHSGQSERTGEARQPCVPVQEVTDTLQTMIGSLEPITTDHSLQAFAPTNFRGPRPRSFDPVAARTAATATAPPMVPAQLWAPGELEVAPAAPVVELSELIRFFTHPAKAFLRTRAGLSLWSDDPPVADEIPIELDGLQRWAIGDRMLSAVVAGRSLEQLVQAEWRSGALPPKALGAAVLSRLQDDLREIGVASQEVRLRPARSIQVTAAAGDREVFGVVPGVRGEQIVEISFSRLSPRHRLTAWIRLLALTVAEPGTRWQALVIGKQGRATSLGPLASADAAARLRDLLLVRELGLSRILPLPLKTAAAQATRQPGSADEPVATVYNDERGDVWDQWFPTFTALTTALASEVDRANSEQARGARTQFEALARRVWSPLLEAEH